MSSKIWWDNKNKPTEQQKAQISEEQVEAYAEKVIEQIIAKGKKPAQSSDDEDIISRMVNYDPEAEETAFTREDALRLLSGVDLRDHIMTTTPAGLAELLLL